MNKKQVYFQINLNESITTEIRLTDSYVLQEIKAGEFSVTSNEPIVLSSLIAELDKQNIHVDFVAYQKRNLEKIFLELVSEV